MIKREEIYPVGKFQKTHALKGELNMISEIDPQYFLEDNPLIVKYDGIYVPFYVETLRKKGSTSFLVKLIGIDKEEEAIPFVNKEIFILKKDADELISLENEENFSLMGYALYNNLDGSKIGEIKDIEDSTSNILFIVTADNENEIFIPANPDFIKKIDDENREIFMELPEGLIELNQKK